jgi:hypothetical protein
MPSNGGLVQFYAETFQIDDKIGALEGSTKGDNSSNSEDGHLQQYTYYTGREINWPGYALTCDTSYEENYQGPCFFALVLALQSSLVTTQTSSRGTDTLQILIDEGSILGGVLFFTWFFSIFVV